MWDFPLFFYILLPIVAMMYASVGHGGASGYLALLALFNANPAIMKPTALILNLFVAGIAFYMYRRNGFFKPKIIIPFIIMSVPAAFIGGYIEVDPSLYKKILGVLLLFSVFRLMGWYGKQKVEIRESNVYLSLFIGLAIGLFSGLIGIGGGIILSPVIILLHWADMKTTAAISALFIWINSLAGLLGMMAGGINISSIMILPIALALIGGFFGAYFGSSKVNNVILQRLLAMVLIIASGKLLLT